MSQAPKDTRSAAEKARDTAEIVASWKLEGYVTTPEAEAVHQRVARGEITTEEAIEIIFGSAKRIARRHRSRLLLVSRVPILTLRKPWINPF
jgi:hypothetical protein